MVRVRVRVRLSVAVMQSPSKTVLLVGSTWRLLVIVAISIATLLMIMDLLSILVAITPWMSTQGLCFWSVLTSSLSTSYAIGVQAVVSQATQTTLIKCMANGLSFFQILKSTWQHASLLIQLIMLTHSS